MNKILKPHKWNILGMCEVCGESRILGELICEDTIETEKYLILSGFVFDKRKQKLGGTNNATTNR